MDLQWGLRSVSADLKTAVITAWKQAAPVTLERARAISQEILTGKDQVDFLKWFDLYGEQTLKRVGCLGRVT